MKSHIIDRLKDEGFSSQEADRALTSVARAIRSVAATVAGGARVPGLGTFKVKNRAGRVGRNPQTGEPVNIAARDVLTFKEGKSS